MAKSIQNNQDMDSIDRIFHALDVESKRYILKADLLQALNDRGILEDDVRIRQTVEGLKKYKDSQRINASEFRKLVAPHITLIEKALTGGLVIPDFKNFASFVTNLYNRTLQNTEGAVSDYIPELANVDPDNYAMSVCTVDGQRFNVGDYKTKYLARSTAKPINYCLAYVDNDEVGIHEHVGRAPKEKGFDYLMLDADNKPHNPLTGSGALMIGSMIKPKAKDDIRFGAVKKIWKHMAGGSAPGFNEKAFASEKKVADSARALGYYMQQRRLFSKGDNVNKHLEFMWKCYALETSTEDQAVIAATLANAGVCPTNEQEIFSPLVAKNCLSLMLMAGMKDYTSEFVYTVGLPATSGSSGVVMIVVPDVMGIVIYSPRIDEHQNSYKGLDFSQKLADRFNFHAFDTALKSIGKRVDPRLKKNATKMKGVMAVTSAASLGDVDELQRLYAAGVNLDEGEYDKRTGIHLAASEGHYDAVKFFIDKRADVNPKDRWGGTPVDDAKREGHKDILALLEKHGGRPSS